MPTIELCSQDVQIDIMGLEYYERYWEHTSSNSSKERDRLTDDGGQGQGGEPIAAQTAVAQDKILKNLKELFDQAGVDDWIAEIDHTITYQSQKQRIMDQYGIRGFEVDKQKELENLKEQKRQRREEAPDDAPMSQRERMERERMKRERFGNTGGNIDDDVEVETIGRDKNINDGEEGQTVNEDENNTISSSLSLTEVRRRCTEAIEEVYQSTDPTIIDALPGMGKTYGAIKAADQTDTTITILVGRGNKGQYNEVKEWCNKFNLSNKILPSSYRDCPTIKGDHGKQIAEYQKGYMNYGLTAGALHDYQDLPCEDSGPCPYEDAWDFDPAQFDIIIGHYLHAHIPEVTENRTVVFDEFPGDTLISDLDLGQYISEFLKNNDDIPLQNNRDLLQILFDKNNNKQKRQDALDWFRDEGFGLPEIIPVMFSNLGTRHALAPLGVLAVLQMSDLGNGWSCGPLREREWAVYDDDNLKIHLLRPPLLSEADNVVALSGTPEYRFWGLVLGIEFDVKRILDTEARRDYVWNVQDLQIIQTEIEAAFSYSGGNADLERDTALIEAVTNEHGTNPTIITSKKVKEDLENFGVQFDGDSTYYGNIRGSNKLSGKEVGVILGSPHPGDDEIQKWAAFFGESVESPDLGQRGKNTSYGPFGDKVFAHLRENEVLQSIFRFGRNGSGATVYVNTAAIPAWLPRQLAVGVARKRTKKERKVIEALSDIESGSGREIANEAGIPGSTATDKLRRLKQEGTVEKTGKKKNTKWHDNGLSSINDYGFVDLTPLTEPLYNIPIRDLGEKASRYFDDKTQKKINKNRDMSLTQIAEQVEQGALAEDEKARKILEQEIEEIRDPSSTYQDGQADYFEQLDKIKEAAEETDKDGE